MGVKSVQVSADSGATWFTLPGSTGNWNDEEGQITDTIFGQTFQSTQPGLISWTAGATAFYKGFAGYVASVKRGGVSTPMTAQPCNLVTGKIYQITLASRRVIDHLVPVTVKMGGVAVSAANILSITYLFGKVEFIASFSVTGAITIDGNYLPMAEVAKANSFTLTQTAATIDKSAYDTAHANNGYRIFDPGLRTVSLELGGFYDATSAFWTVLESRGEIVLEINPDGSGLSLARGIFKMVTRTQSGDVGALEVEPRTFNLSVPAGVDIPFTWDHDPATTLSQGIRILLDAFINQTKPMVRYMPDGLNATGFRGTCVVTNITLGSSLSAMNEFTVAFQGNDQPIRGIVS